MAPDEATGFFHTLYEAAARGEREIPWDREGPHPLIAAWGQGRAGEGRRALVVGSGLGMDAEFIAGLGYEVTAFDVAPLAIEETRRRFPDSRVDYRVADLLEPPPEWQGAFDLVVESLTVQSMPPQFHAPAIESIAGFVAAGGTLLVVATAADPANPFEGPPFPLRRDEVAAFASAGLDEVRVELVRDPGVPPRWRAEFARRAPG